MNIPPLVRRAERLAAELEFTKSCLPEVGRLLHVLAAQRGRTRAAEIGTGAGVGAAWIVSALPPSVPFYTAEIEPELAARTQRLFADDSNVYVLAGDWHDVLPPHAPFDLLFLDAAKQEPERDGDQVLALLGPGGDRRARRPITGVDGTRPRPQVLARPSGARVHRAVHDRDHCGDRRRARALAARHRCR